MKIHIFNIQWCTDGETPSLPNELHINIKDLNLEGPEDYENISLKILDYLSDEYGWLVDGYELKNPEIAKHFKRHAISHSIINEYNNKKLDLDPQLDPHSVNNPATEIILDKMEESSKMSKEEIRDFIRDIQRLINMGIWFSDACIIVLTLKDYNVHNTDMVWWDYLMHFCIAKVKTQTRRPILDRYQDIMNEHYNLKGY